MIKSWYLHVREETMAPARMISFIEEHATSCDICRIDPELKEEIAKITEIVLPESKIPKAVRQKSSEEEEPEDDEKQEDEVSENDDEEETDDSIDDDTEEEDDLKVEDDE